jgi:Fic family protein
MEKHINVDTLTVGEMFIEPRKQGKKTKFYLIHTYRAGDRIKRVSRYLGSDLSSEALARLKPHAERLILEQVREKSIFDFELSRKDISEYKQYTPDVEILHLNKTLNWTDFTELFTYNTNAIEGSSLEYAGVRKIVEQQEIPCNADELEAQGVSEAVDFIRTSKEKFSVDLIKKLHLLCFRKTKPFAGELRKVDVVIRDRLGCIVHRGAPYKQVKNLLENLVKWYRKHKHIYPPLLLAALVHDEFENIHPFQDGNGRVGRLLLNYVLLAHSYPPLNIRLGDRYTYYKVLQEFEMKNNIRPSLQFFISQYRKQYPR